MTPLRWNWSSWLTETRRPTRWLSIVPWPLRPLGQVGTARVDRAARVAKGQRGHVGGFDGRFERALAPGVPRIVARRFAQWHARCLTLSYWAVGPPVDRHDG